MFDLIVGLGNPGPTYAGHRHNIGAIFVQLLAEQAGTELRSEKKFKGDYGKAVIAGRPVHLLFPNTYMNESGQAVQALCQFFKLSPERMLVVHDELDLPSGQARLKFQGGHGGHNGLRSIMACLGGTKDFYRLRLGIGHPGHKSRVTGYVLSDPDAQQQVEFIRMLEASQAVLPALLDGDFQGAMQTLHSTT